MSDLLTAVIARAEAVEPAINAFAETRYEEALELARSAQERYAGTDRRRGRWTACRSWSRKRPRSRARRTPWGSLPLRKTVADHTAAFVQRIIDAGG